MRGIEQTRAGAPPLVGRTAGRATLQLGPLLHAEIEQLSQPNGWVFSAWTGWHLCWWAAGLIGVIHAQGWLAVQLSIALLLGSQLHALTVLQHDCGHRSAFRDAAANLWVGRVLAWFIYMPFTTFTELHRRHHAHTGDAAHDPDEWFYDAGAAKLFLRECLFMPRFIWLSLGRGLPVQARRRVRAELLFNSCTHLGLAVGLIWLDAAQVWIFGFLIPMLCLGLLFNPISRGYEHYPLACMRADDPRRHDLRFNTVTVTSSAVGLMWANINFHVEHHLYPRVPFFRLPRLHRMLSDKRYLTAPYPLWGLKRYRDASMSAPIETASRTGHLCSGEHGPGPIRGFSQTPGGDLT